MKLLLNLLSKKILYICGTIYTILKTIKLYCTQAIKNVSVWSINYNTLQNDVM